MTRLPARYAPTLTAILLSGMMSCLISGVATARNVGFSGVFLGSWMQAWAFAWPVAFVAMSVLFPIVRAIVARLVVPADQPLQRGH